MKLYFLVLLVIFAVIIADTNAEVQKRKHKKFRRRRPSTESSVEIHENDSKDSNADAYSMMEQDEASDALREAEAKMNQESLARENERARESARNRDAEGEITDNTVPMYQDPCSRVHCGAGRVCRIDEMGDPECSCIETCPVETESRRKVCSNHNETWTSDCSVYQHRCWCDSEDNRCKGKDYHHVHIEYYGECREMPECTDEEMSDFPRRMRDWLFNIMRDLADREELTPHYLKMEREAETNMTRRWANAAIWKWCDLDGHPHDRSISRHELFPIRAPLMSLEHCMAPFLDSCDSNNDHHISLTEWGKCLEIDEEELEDKCEEIASAHDI